MQPDGYPRRRGGVKRYPVTHARFRSIWLFRGQERRAALSRRDGSHGRVPAPVPAAGLAPLEHQFRVRA